MNIVTYILLSIAGFILLVLLIGILLPAERIVTRQSVFDTSPKELYTIVIDNENWKYRSRLTDLQMISRKDGMEVWDEFSEDGSSIRFETREKTPYSFYSFDMKSKLFTGYWTASFDKIEGNKTLFVATEHIRIGNPFLKVISYIFFDIGKFMEVYQEDLRKESVKRKAIN